MMRVSKLKTKCVSKSKLEIIRTIQFSNREQQKNVIKKDIPSFSKIDGTSNTKCHIYKNDNNRYVIKQQTNFVVLKHHNDSKTYKNNC